MCVTLSNLTSIALFVSNFYPNAKITHHHHHHRNKIVSCPGQVVCVVHDVFCFFFYFFLHSARWLYLSSCQWVFRHVLGHLKCFSGVYTATSMKPKETTGKIVDIGFQTTQTHATQKKSVYRRWLPRCVCVEIAAYMDCVAIHTHTQQVIPKNIFSKMWHASYSS